MTRNKKIKQGQEKDSWAWSEEKQEAYSHVTRQSEGRLYLEGMILLFVKLYWESLPCRIPHSFLTAVELL